MSNAPRYSIEASMALTHEDRLRLHVLLRNVCALRIDEREMTVHGLAERGEAVVKLNPDCRPELYLKRVREFISAQVTGSPGGFPVYLERWTRMGQARDESLEDLLMLGVPEAVAAVACAPGLSDELARRAWWVAPDSENARRMLEREAVARGSMGPVLAAYLVEHLPFETEPHQRLDTVRLLLQHRLLDEDTRHRLWQRGARENAIRVAFLAAAPGALPVAAAPRADFARFETTLAQLAAAGNGLAALLRHALDAPGQAFAATAGEALSRLTDRDMAAAAFAAVGGYYRSAWGEAAGDAELDDCLRDLRAALDRGEGRTGAEAAALIAALPDLRDEVRAVLLLGRIGEATVRDFLGHTSASGSVLRKQIEPYVAPVVARLDWLQRRNYDE